MSITLTPFVYFLIVYFIINIFFTGGYFILNYRDNNLDFSDSIMVVLIPLLGVLIYIFVYTTDIYEHITKKEREKSKLRKVKNLEVKFYLQLGKGTSRIIAHWVSNYREHFHVLADEKTPHYCIEKPVFYSLLMDGMLVEITARQVRDTRTYHLHKQIWKQLSY